METTSMKVIWLQELYKFASAEGNSSPLLDWQRQKKETMGMSLQRDSAIQFQGQCQ